MITKTGSIIRMCDCENGYGYWPPTNCLEVMTNGVIDFAYCPFCKKQWDVNTLKELVKPIEWPEITIKTYKFTP